MKKSILLAIIGLTGAVVTSSYGQGAILLSNYVSSSNIPSVIRDYGNNPIASGLTVGLYWAAGNVLGSVAADPTGFADPSTLGGGLALGTGLGSTAALAGSSVFGIPGAYHAWNAFVTGLPGSSVITLEIVAYNGSSYTAANTIFRGHSSAFVMTTTSGPTPNVPMTGVFETDGGFKVWIPEPTTLALGGLALAALLFFRRKQA